MQIHHWVSPRLLLAITCALLASCASRPSSPPEPQVPRPMDYTTAPEVNTAPGASSRRLTIQSGEGERLNLPWFIQDAQNWVNE